MNITQERIDDLNATLKVQIEKEDYEEKVSNVLKDYRKKANIPGFRPGKVPFGMINKMYRKPVMADEINKIVSESISKYIVNEDLKILGEPMPNETETPEIDWDNQDKFEFVFDLGLQPEFEVKLSKKDKIKYYQIKVDDTLIEKYKQSYTQRFGSYQSAEEISDKEMIKANITQVDQDGNELEDGIKVEESTMSVEVIKDEEIKKKFVGLKVNDTIICNIKKAYPNDSEIAAILKIEKEQAQVIDSDFKLEIKEITKFLEAEINQDLFDKIYGKDVVKSEDEFKTKIIDDIKLNLSRESDYKFSIDAKESVLKKTTFDLPVEFLKRWLKTVNKEKLTDEQFDEEFPKFENDLKWQLVKNRLIKDNNIEVSDEEIKQEAINYTRMQFAQYGMGNIPDEQLEGYAENILKKEDEKRQLYERKFEEKVLVLIKETVKLDEKEVSTDDFNKLFEKK